MSSSQRGDIQARALTLKDIQEGDTYSFQQVISESMLNDFAQLSGDFSPIHVNAQFAAERGFPNRVVHGALLISLLSRLVGMYFPGQNALIQSINTQFSSPAYMGDEVLVKAVVDQKSEAANVIVLKVSLERAGTPDILAKGKIQVGFTGA